MRIATLPNCSECGRFCIPQDSGTMYGSYNDYEPPEDVLLCPRCADRKMAEAIRAPATIIVGCWWRKPDYVSVAKSILRHRRKHGNVQDPK